MSEESKPVFDAGQKFKIKHLTSAGIKIVEVAFPSDEDWLERESRRRTIITFNAGTGEPDSSREEPDGDEVELAKKLCSDLVDVDPVEAGRLIDQLAYVDIANLDEILQGNHMVVRMNVLRALTEHVFKMPTARELDKFKKSAHDQKNISKRRVASVINLRMAQQLYSEMKESVSGYKGNVPIIHQCAAVFAVFNELESALDSRMDP